LIPVYWFSLHKNTLNRGQFDDTVLNDLFDGKFGATGYTFEHHEVGGLEPGDGGIVVLHARMHDQDINVINKQLAKLGWALVVLVGDEQNLFPWESLKHPNMKTWVMHPMPDRHKEADWYLINGYAPDTRLLKNYRAEYDEKPLDWFFSGQLGHKRREECQEAAQDIPGGEFIPTKGFTQGLDHGQYFKKLASAKFALCPSGPCTPDTFRLYEALEAGCIPIVDSSPPRKYPTGFWENLFGEAPPFPILEDWGSLQGTIEELLPDWKTTANRVFAWWQRYKRKMANHLQTDIFYLSEVSPLTSDITALVPSSTIGSHPSTDMINETIASIRERLPAAEIIVTVDGLRPQQEDSRRDYDDYKRALLWESNQADNILPVIFDALSHQSLMAKATIDNVRTPYLLYCEQDTPLFGDIPFDRITRALGELNLIRFSHEASILEPHKHMMVDSAPIEVNGLPVVRTMQYSQRPHIARTEWYRWILSEYFGEKSVTFIEWVMYGILIHSWETDGFLGWAKFRTAIYAPPDGEDGIRRSANLNGRQNDPVYPPIYDYGGDPPPGAPT